MWLNCEKHLPGFSNGNMKQQFDKKILNYCNEKTEEEKFKRIVIDIKKGI